MYFRELIKVNGDAKKLQPTSPASAANSKGPSTEPCGTPLTAWQYPMIKYYRLKSIRQKTLNPFE
ncbi:MAG: hypothetical protein MUF38_10525, partial [Anaerolineae bacterium]|nr:hypothetical protein [Anaerolineae bacterium]